ncbi:HPP family protein [Pelomonas sp. KK5]|uniref:HPP family protein n=1 Tax=Pelomonas sp. KK5 TaxID=1855730 RepID=UPI00097C9D65|nr:HPP family protein [Pelomonas sp. KK5]
MSSASSISSFWRALWPAAMAVNGRERVRAAVGAGIGMLLTGLLAQLCVATHAMPSAIWLVAPLGASAVLVFCVPASPLAQPWSVVGGDTLSALVGIACFSLLGGTAFSAALAVALAIAVMFALRCLHPPGGAAALLMVMAGVHDWRFAIFPVLVNTLALVSAGMVYNRLTGRAYPHVSQPPAAAPAGTPQFAEADLDAALARYNQVLDIPRDDLAALLHEAQLHAYERQFGTLRCADIMSREPLSVQFGTPLQEAWQLLRERGIKALPVVDRANRVIGIVTLTDFMRAAPLDEHDGFANRLRGFLQATPGPNSDKAEVVGQIMSRTVRVVSADRPVAELVPLFASTGHHHIPIVGTEARLVGILTQSDLVAAIARSTSRAT